MTQQAAQSGPDVAPMGLVSRFVGIIISPRETFARVAAHPRWLGMLIVTVAVTASLAVWFQTTDVGRQASLDQAIKGMETFGIKVTDEQYSRMETSIMDAPVWRIVLQTGVAIVVVSPIVYLVMAGILFGVFSAALGGGAAFKQVFATIVHAGVISTIGQVFVYPLYYLRESMTSPTNLGVLFPMLAENSFLAKFLGTIDLFTVWWVIVLAIGMAVVYRRKTRPIALSFFAIYGVIAVVIAAIQAMRSGS
jgi:hypothetical protein